MIQTKILEFMKALLSVRVLFDQRHGRPDRMEQHEHDGKQAGHAMSRLPTTTKTVVFVASGKIMVFVFYALGRVAPSATSAQLRCK